MKAIMTKYIGPTTYRGSRIKAYDCDKNQVTQSYQYELGSFENHEEAAYALCAKMDWRVDKFCSGWTGKGYVFCFGKV